MSEIEFVVICIDNSDYMRNEDVRPNRFMAQKDSANITAHHILSLRTENRVGVVTLAGSPHVVQSLTTNEINLLRKLYAIEMNGEIDLTKAIKVPLLALKQGLASLKGLVPKNTRQRIIVFIGSPINDEEIHFNHLVDILKKMKISVDIIVFGSENQNKIEILKSFVSKLIDSHLVVVPNDRSMANVLAESDILAKSGDFRLANETVDPELALAMKLSIENLNRQNQIDTDIRRGNSQSKNQSSNSNTLSSTDEDDLMKAIKMSLNQNGSEQGSGQSKSRQLTEKLPKSMSEEELLAHTLQMSLLDSNKNSPKSEQNLKKEPIDSIKKTDISKVKTDNSKGKTPKNN